MSLMEVRYGDSRRLQMKWTDEQITELTRMWVTEQMSSGQIAAEFGVTRNTVIGKVGRLGLSGRACDLENKSKGAAMREARLRLKAARQAERLAKPPPQKAPQKAPMRESPAAAPCSLLELNDTKCHWPIGEPGNVGFHFCGGRVTERSYCAAHYQIAYSPRGPGRPSSQHAEK